MFLLVVMNACSLSIDAFSNNLDKAIRTSNDPATIAQALPAYILLLDSLIESDPEDEETLKASADLLNAYSGLISIEYELSDSDENADRIQNRLRKMTEKSMERASSAICYYESRYCNVTKESYNELVENLKTADEDEVQYLFSLAQSWTGKLQANREDWNVTAKIPQIKHIFEVIIQLEPDYQQGSAYMYLGVLNSLIPKTLGGKPETGKQYFEKAISVSKQNNLMAKVLFAEYYARLVFDQELHDGLLKEVEEDTQTEKQYSLMNTLAKLKAKQLINSGTDYF